MKVIDATNSDLMKECMLLKKDLVNDKLQKGYVTENDFMLVRATDYLNSNHTLKPLYQEPFVLKIYNEFYSAFLHEYEKEHNIDLFTVSLNDEEEYERIQKEVTKDVPYSTQYRSTIHFTLNGLVSSHSKGNFDHRKFIILEPLKNQIKNGNMLSFRMEDTFFEGEMILSEDATILIDENEYETLKNEIDLSKYHVVLYRGDAKSATEIALTKLGIVSETILTDYAKDSEMMPLIRDFSEKLNQDYGIEAVKHYHSKNYREDDEKNLILWDIYTQDFYTFLLNELAFTDMEQEDIINYLDEEDVRRKFLEKLIDQYGLHQIIQIIHQYNNEIDQAIISGTYPTNEEILKKGKIIKNNEVFFGKHR